MILTQCDFLLVPKNNCTQENHPVLPKKLNVSKDQACFQPGKRWEAGKMGMPSSSEHLVTEKEVSKKCKGKFLKHTMVFFKRKNLCLIELYCSSLIWQDNNIWTLKLNLISMDITSYLPRILLKKKNGTWKYFSGWKISLPKL